MTTRDTKRTTEIEEMFAPQVKAMHGIPFEEGELRRCGRGWRIDPAWGEGTYWYYSMNSTAAFAVFDLEFHRKTDMSMHCADMLCFGSYGRGMIPYFTAFSKVDDGVETGTLLGYIWHDSFYRNIVQPGSPLAVTSLALTPEGATQMAARIGVDPLTLASAIAALDGTHRNLALLHLFDEVRRTCPGEPVARAYYDSKAVEACALVVDWWNSLQRKGGARIRPADRTAFNLACAYAREHLGGALSLEDLCQASCVSASKLTGLFKEIENATPMGWVRDRRMERACQLLVQTDDSLAAVSAAVGFARQGSFSEAFKDRFGVTPHAFRAMRGQTSAPQPESSRAGEREP